MKKTDIAMIILIASVSVLIAYFAAKAVVGDVKNESVKVQTAEQITPDIVKPDSDDLKTVFNKDAINPTVEVIIGNDKSQSSDTSTDQSSNQ